MRILFFILALCFLKINAKTVKSSLAFVFDITRSMSEEIEEVKLGAQAILDAVVNSHISHIDTFVLVTFADKDVKWLITTENVYDFKIALNKIGIDRISKNPDCPEASMHGIKTALQHSKEGSSLYVFTDAPANDYNMYEEVEELSQTMGCQIVFVVSTGCDPDPITLYNNLAPATNGQVFRLEHNGIGQILNYVQFTVESRKNLITSKTFPRGYGNKFDVTVDGDTKELVVAVSGVFPSVEMIGSDGKALSMSYLARLEKVAVVKAVDAKPGVYKVEVGSGSETHVVVSGSSSVHFQYGFSGIKPSAITETEERPVPGEMSHLCIDLDAEGVNLESLSVQILLMDESIYLEKPLNLVDRTEQFYITERITPPNKTFKIAVKGYDPKSKTFITRLSLTPVKVQRTPDTITDKFPVVSIDGKPKINAKYDQPLQLKCRVSGYPPPTITWDSDDDDKSKLLPTNYKVKIPYDYISVLDVSGVTKNATYSCKAVNRQGTGDSSVAVQTIRPNFFKIVATPKDTTIEYHKAGNVSCKVDAFPPATVSWYKSERPLKPDGNLELSTDGFVLTIRSMEPYMIGDYKYEVKNSVEIKYANFRININGTYLPQIKKTGNKHALKNSKADIQCQIIKGLPKPTLQWFYTAIGHKEIKLRQTAETIHIDNVTIANAGTYRCKAENYLGNDNHRIELIMEYEPSISRTFQPNMVEDQKKTVILPCLSDGSPTPDITWKYNGTVLRNSRYTVLRNGSLSFLATLPDEGVYECEAKNIHGKDSITITLNITVPITIEPPVNNIVKQEVGSDVTLLCRAYGLPEPSIQWYHVEDSESKPMKIEHKNATGALWLLHIQLKDSGEYICNASNYRGFKTITYEVSATAPPYIVKKTEFHAVVNDLQLTVPCEAYGNPKPNVTWSTKGEAIVSGTEKFDIDANGSLIIKKIDKKSEGTYTCTASNEFKKVKEDFKVVVNEFPHVTTTYPKKSIHLEENKRAVIKCSIPFSKSDGITWFKDKRVVGSSEPLKLTNVTKSDSGLYVCRVSHVNKPAQTKAFKLIVGSPPRFNDSRKTVLIPFLLGKSENMDCTVTGTPTLQVTWHQNGTKRSITGFKHSLKMTRMSENTTYTCRVRNPYGYVERKFDIVSVSNKCLLDAEADFQDINPLMLTLDNQFVDFETKDGYMHIPKGKKVKLICPSVFNKIPSSEITAECVNEKQFMSSGKHYTYSDLKCRDKFQPSIDYTNTACAKRAKMWNVGFKMNGKFKNVYTICVDTDKNTTLYTTVTMLKEKPLANIDKHSKWFNIGESVDLGSLYNCHDQNKRISSLLRRNFHKNDNNCFKKTMLVNPLDVAAGLPQATTFTHLNVVPHWTTPDTQNWKKLEEIVKNRVMKQTLIVHTGIAENLQLSDISKRISKKGNLTLSSKRYQVQIPKYLWKVIEDPFQKASLVFIQVNIPDFKYKGPPICTDKCRQAKWITVSGKKIRNELINSQNGYTYCCNLVDFESIFTRYKGSFLYTTELLDLK